MELCNGGDLDRLKDLRGGRFSEIEARIILQQLVSGFKEIYKQQVMHRDLKLANILVNLPDYPHNLVGAPGAGKSKAERKVLVEDFLRGVDLCKKG
jgi:serine/threonine protein kinase